MVTRDSELQFPGLKKKANRFGERLYWAASKPAVREGYEPKFVRIHAESPEELSSRCLLLQAEMLEWLSRKHENGSPINPTVSWLIVQYVSRDESPFNNNIKWNTRRTYQQALDVLESVCGDMKLSALNLSVFQRIYNDARWPEGKDGSIGMIRKAYGIISIIRRIVAFGVAIEVEQCVRLDAILSKTRFEQPKTRSVIIEYGDIISFIKTAVDNERMSLALGTAIQFECAFRQKDVIGEWEPAHKKSNAKFVLNNRQWVNGIEWENIDKNWIIEKLTTKTEVGQTWDLKLCPISFRLLNMTPFWRREGPIIIDEASGRPYATDAYHREWRKIANKAGLPRGVWNMDCRAGAATEADLAGAELALIQPALGHKDAKTTAGYVRSSNLEKTREIARMRITHRAKNTADSGAGDARGTPRSDNLASD